MLITRKSVISGITRTLDINITQKQLDDWNSGTVAQRAFPQLDANDREFIMTGITPEEWDEFIPEEL